jgi:hypothetical protein
VAEGRGTPKGQGASGGGRKGGSRTGGGTPNRGRTTSGTAKTPRRGPRPTGTSGSTGYGRARPSSGRAGQDTRTGRGGQDTRTGRGGQDTRTGRGGQDTRTGRGGAGRDGATGEGSRRAPRAPATDRQRQTTRTSRAGATAGSSARTFRGDGPRHTREGSAEDGASLERGTRGRPAEGRERRGPAGAGRRSWDGTPARPAERPASTRAAERPGPSRAAERPGGSRSRVARAGTDQAPVRGPRVTAADGDGAAYRPRESGPRLPDTITAQQLDPEARAQLHSLPNDLADTVARYLVAAGMAEDQERGYEYAQAARRLAARVGVVREASGIAAYQTGRWAEALSELRAARRLTGRDDYLPVMADCERALGRLDRALALIREADTSTLDRATQIEFRIVESGIRRDQGLADAAVIALQVPELTSGRLRPWSARLFYAYADALLAAGRTEEARNAFARAAAADADGETDAADRLDELDGIEFEDLAESEDQDS